jgi:hypothetical protein
MNIEGSVAVNPTSKKESIKFAARQLFFHFCLTKTSMEDIARQMKKLHSFIEISIRI